MAIQPTIINFGGSCEPLHALRARAKELSSVYPNIEADVFQGPFDWIGIPSTIFPQLLTTEWYNDAFSTNQVITYNCMRDGFIGVRDLKYRINTIHHFKRHLNDNYHNTLNDQLPKFREELIRRWRSLRSILEHKHAYIIYRDFYPPYENESPNDISLRKVYDAIISFAPQARLILVTDNQPKQTMKKASVVIQKHFIGEFFRNPGWFSIWKIIADKIHKEEFEPGKTY